MGILRAKCDRCGVEGGDDDISQNYEGRYLCKNCHLDDDIKNLERDIKNHEGTIENANKKIAELRRQIKELQSQKDHFSIDQSKADPSRRGR